MADFDGWEKIEPPLGEGGQGKVYRARSPARAEQVAQSRGLIVGQLRHLNGIEPYSARTLDELMTLIVDIGSPDDIKHLGALKIFKMPDDSSEQARAYKRLEQEISSLANAHHPAVLKLLHSHPDQHFIVTEFHPLGTLDHLDRYKGRALDALLAFRPLVEAVSSLHKQDVIHRDIKLKNIFVATDYHLVLGDFGIVLFKDGSHARPTETYERVGSRDWMAPWANTAHRFSLDEVNATFDIFPLGKVLWCMIAGRPGLEYWYYLKEAKGDTRPANNLEQLFPGDAAMRAVNNILSKCVVEDEDRCLKTADELLAVVDQVVASLRSPGQWPEGDLPWLCRVCGKGRYVKADYTAITPSRGNDNRDG